MAGKADEAGRAFMAGILSKIENAEVRQAWQTALDNPESAGAVIAIGAGALAQSDINKKYDDLKTKEDALTEDYTKLNDWYTGRKADFDQVDEMKKAGTWGKKPVAGDPPTRQDPPIDPTKYISREDFEKTMRGEQLAAANFLALQTRLVLQHQARFGEILDSRELLTDPNLGKQKQDGSVYGFEDAYNTKFRDKLAEFSQKQEQDRIEKLADARVAEKMKGVQLPIPLKGGGGSPLDVLDGSAEFKPDPNLAQTAAEEYARLTAARG
jgi:hypothetical protein